MVLATGLVIVGLAGLYAGAELLIRGAAGFARSFGIRPMIIGLTVVAYGTSLPELVVSGAAALRGSSGIALGNVVGSNVANLGIVLAVATLVRPLRVEGGLLLRLGPWVLGSSAAMALALWDGMVRRWEGGALLLAGIAFTSVMVRRGTAAPDLPEPRNRSALAAFVVAGMLLLAAGGDVFVRGAIRLALAFGLSERAIGLTLVAFGTSLPELASSIVAAARGHHALAVGNLLGSNVFNVLFVLAVAALLRPVDGAIGGDLAAMGAVTALALVFVRAERTLGRVEGGILLTAYAAFLVWIAFR